MCDQMSDIPLRSPDELISDNSLCFHLVQIWRKLFSWKKKNTFCIILMLNRFSDILAYLIYGFGESNELSKIHILAPVLF